MNNARSIAFWVVLFLLILALFNLISGGQTTLATSTVSYSDFVERVEGAHALAGGEVLGGDPAFGKLGDAGGEALGA